MVGHTYCVCMAYMWKSVSNLKELVFSLHHVSLELRSSKLAGKCLYLLSHLSGPSRISETYMSLYLDHIFPSYPLFLHFFLPNSTSSTFFVVCFKTGFFWVALAVPLLCYLIYSYIFLCERKHPSYLSLVLFESSHLVIFLCFYPVLQCQHYHNNIRR